MFAEESVDKLIQFLVPGDAHHVILEARQASSRLFERGHTRHPRAVTFDPSWPVGLMPGR